MTVNKKDILVASLFLIFSSFLIHDQIGISYISTSDKSPISNTPLIDLFEPIGEFKPIINVKPAKLISATKKTKPTHRVRNKKISIVKNNKRKEIKTEAPIKIKLNVRHENNLLYIRNYNKSKVIFDISDATGFVLYKGKIKTKQQTLSLNDLLPGVYYLNAHMENKNIHKKSFRFIVES
jgi:hypothetical protein